MLGVLCRAVYAEVTTYRRDLGNCSTPPIERPPIPASLLVAIVENSLQLPIPSDTNLARFAHFKDG